MNITLVPLKDDDREQFILDNQEAFNYGALEEFGRRDDHFEDGKQIISCETIEQSIEDGEASDMMHGALSRSFTLKYPFGKPSHHILKQGTSTSM